MNDSECIRQSSFPFTHRNILFLFQIAALCAPSEALPLNFENVFLGGLGCFQRPSCMAQATQARFQRPRSILSQILVKLKENLE